MGQELLVHTPRFIGISIDGEGCGTAKCIRSAPMKKGSQTYGRIETPRKGVLVKNFPGPAECFRIGRRDANRDKETSHERSS